MCQLPNEYLYWNQKASKQLYEIYFWPRLTKSEKQERQQNEKKKVNFEISTITEVTLLRKSVGDVLFVHLEIISEIPILLWQAGAFFSLKTMDGWQSVFCYHEPQRGPLKLWHHGFHIEGLPTLAKDLRQHFHICWCPMPISINQGFRTRKNIIRRVENEVGTNNKLKFVSYYRLQLSQYGLRHRPAKVKRKMEHCKEGEVICK